MEIKWKNSDNSSNGSFDINSTGEGIVWSHNSEEYGFLQMKIKGERHVMPTTSIAGIDVAVDVKTKIIEFANSVGCSELRFQFVETLE